MKPATETHIIDYTVHGLITIRLVDPPPSAVRELEFLLGPSEGRPAEEPDVCITYVEGLSSRGALRYIGLNESAYDSEGFYLLNERGRRATFDFERLGEPCTFVCERGGSIFPYLLPVISLRLLRKGYVMLHAASFAYEGTGVLVMGWQKGGKTETLLAFMAAGAQYLADEWTILSPAEGKMWGVPGALQVWDWHLRYLPEYWARLRPAERARLRLLRLYQRAYHHVPRGWRGRGPGGQWLERLSLDGGNALVGQTRSAPQRLFREQVRQGSAPIDVAFLAGVGTALRLETVTPSEIARRMVASLAFERRALLARYEQFRFAFPDRHSEILETAREREFEYLNQALEGRPAYEIVHPYPVPLHALYEACMPVLPQEHAEKPHDAVVVHSSAPV
jgi:hypothetical protein